jgi:hypothetical protein
MKIFLPPKIQTGRYLASPLWRWSSTIEATEFFLLPLVRLAGATEEDLLRSYVP